MNARAVPAKFLVAFSFAGEQRELVRGIAERVESLLGRGTVFLDEWYEFYIAGADADTRLQEVYCAKSEMAIVCVSAAYGGKPWTLAEHEAIRGLKMQLQASTDTNASFRILPLRVGDGDVKGILFNTICPDVRNKPVDDTAELIINRLRLLRPDLALEGPSSSSPSRERLAFLAECTPDMDDRTKPINRARLKAFLEDAGWKVLPEHEYPENAAEYRTVLEADLKRCLAFVQLLGPYPWKRGNYDRLQNEVATAVGLPRFRYRSSEIDVAKLEDEAHRQFLAAPDVIACGFEDFKVQLKNELTVLAHRRDTAANGHAAGDLPPSVLVVIRSADPDPLWEKVFEWIYEEEKITPHYLKGEQTLTATHAAEPCHGFLVVCDSAALQDGPLSPRPDMEECRLIQMKEKDALRRPPVGLIYWPPPQPGWAKLLKSIPPKLYRIVGDAPETRSNLGEFFADVRKVAG